MESFICPPLLVAYQWRAKNFFATLLIGCWKSEMLQWTPDLKHPSIIWSKPTSFFGAWGKFWKWLCTELYLFISQNLKSVCGVPDRRSITLLVWARSIIMKSFLSRKKMENIFKIRPLISLACNSYLKVSG